MDGSFVKALAELMQPFLTVINGVEYSNKGFEPIMPPMADYLQVHSLSAVVDFCEYELTEDDEYVIHIETPGLVWVRGSIDPTYRQREKLLCCVPVLEPFLFGKEIPVEQFVIKMQALFVQDDTTAAILKRAGNMTAEAKTTIEDDGVTQRVTVRNGIAKVTDAEVPNPVTLRPYRTFTEIEQPASKFVFRINTDAPSCALYEADGGAWKNDAIASVAGWLRDHLEQRAIMARVVVLA